MLKIIQNIEEAKATLLKRLTPGQERIPLALRDKIKEVFGADLSPEEVVRKIINEVQSRGDEAIRDYSKALDGIALQQLEVPPDAMIEAYRRVDNEVLSALELAAERIRAFHLRQKYEPWMDFTEGGLGQIVQPLEKVGIYAPGGTACYPSTVLMTAIPARVAGVKEIILSTPPQPGGTVNPLMLAAAYIAQVDRVFVIGGAQAVAAMAFGTSSVPKVDKICGP
ncbi:MAG: histidinol dehydrogenase, partial [Chloroflexi bacterium]|nr:histidinol dehydrogenase [Chloroflexota bacterium]